VFLRKGGKNLVVICGHFASLCDIHIDRIDYTRDMTEETGTTRRKKSGFPSSSIFDNAQLVHSFSKISRALTESKTFPYNFKLDEQSLANVSFQLQTFMELSLGKSSPLSARTITKIPQFNFHDNSVDGSLMCMLKVALAYQFKEGWDVFNLTLPERFSNGVEIIRSIEALLTEVSMSDFRDESRGFVLFFFDMCPITPTSTRI
jgi:hypothetical protein